MIDQLPIDSLNNAVSYLDLNSIRKLLQSSKHIGPRLPVLQRIVKATSNHSIYENEILLNEVYSNYPQFVAEWMDIKRTLLYGHTILNLQQFKQSSKILKFNNWEELYQCHDYFDNIRFSGVCKILAPKPLVSHYDKTYALICTSSSGPIELLSSLLKDPRLDGIEEEEYSTHDMALAYAASFGQLDSARLLLEDDRFDPSHEENYAIVVAAEQGHLEMLRLLLTDERVDPSDDENMAIRKASKNGHLEVVKLLLQDERVDPSDFENEALRVASENEHLEIVQVLLKDPRVDHEAIRIV